VKIQIKNTGNIKELEFELKDGLTIFCGSNNTGKTYAAYIIYSILKGFSRVSPDWVNTTDLKKLLKNSSVVIDESKRKNKTKFLNEISKSLTANLDSDFDAPVDFFTKASVFIDFGNKRPIVSTIKKRTKIEIGPTTFEFFIEDEKIVITSISKSSDKGEFEIPIELLRRIVNQEISSFYAENFLGRVFVFTAERSAVNLFSRELSSSRNALVDQLLSLGNGDKQNKLNFREFVGQRAKRYSLPVRDGLEIAEDLKAISKGQGEFTELAKKLELEILGGGVKINDNGDLLYEPTNSEAIRINLTASLVKSLSSLVIYLRFQSRKGDLIIIDEPEMNLHPDNQRRIARFLCEVVNNGINVLLSTHSDYILREINNSIILKQPKLAKVKKRNSYDDTEVISENQVSVLLFKRDGLPEPVSVTKFGFSVTTIDEEINSLNQISEDILLELNKDD
jgi:hypothetical protein